MELTQETHKALLAHLDADENRAKVKLEFIYCNLVVFFKHQKNLLADPEDYAIETISRVAERIQQGVNIRKSLGDFIHGVKRILLLEKWRNEKKTPKDIDRVPIEFHPVVDPFEEENERDLNEWERQRCECTRQCFEKLSPEKSKFFGEFQEAKEQGGLDELAERLQTTRNALEIRACRIRAEVKSCVKPCLKSRQKD